MENLSKSGDLRRSLEDLLGLFSVRRADRMVPDLKSIESLSPQKEASCRESPHHRGPISTMVFRS
jgi:hypothetical protein